MAKGRWWKIFFGLMRSMTKPTMTQKKQSGASLDDTDDSSFSGLHTQFFETIHGNELDEDRHDEGNRK